MNQLEVFFDYACPFCFRGHEYLKELICEFPRISILWRPCEAHPRPDSYGPHSDLCIQGMFYAEDMGIDLWSYHDRMYRAALKERIFIEHVETLADYVKDLLDYQGLCHALHSGAYLERLKLSNEYAYLKNGVYAVPSYRMNNRKLDSIENIGITKKHLAVFLREGMV